METISSRIDAQKLGNRSFDKPLVSVIINFFNAEQFLQEAIESVLSQTYDAWELLLVDDGSTDCSKEIAQYYSMRCPGKVQCIEHPGHQNLGTSASRNLGIANAQGEYIAFLDADDVWLPFKLQQQVDILETHPEAGMLYGLSEWWYGWTGKQEDIQRDFVHPLGIPPNILINPPELLIPFFITQTASIPNPSNILIRRKIIDSVGGFEENFRGMYDEQALYAKVLLITPVFASNECWDRYRQHPDSITAMMEQRGTSFQARLYFLNWLVSYIASQGLGDTETSRLLRREIWFYRYPFLYHSFRNNRLISDRLKDQFFKIGRLMLPAPFRQWLWAYWQGHKYIPPAGWARLGDLRRVVPLSRDFGFDRGQPVDRYYIERFLITNQADIRGSVLEVQDNTYTRQFGGERVIKSEVLHVQPGHPGVTIVGDLTRSELFSEDAFDCIILSQTLQFIYDVPAALRTLYKILRPGGVALVTMPGISQVSRYDMDQWGHYWSFTTLSARWLFEEAFPPECVQVEMFGNVLSSTAFLYGIATQELRPDELDFRDPDYELIITVRAVKQ